MWDEMQIQFSDAIEIAEALINNEVNISQLKSMHAFGAKADLVEDAVWDICKNSQNLQRYIDIYPSGKHKSEIEEYMWRAAVQKNDMNGFIGYMNNYPQGKHVGEVDDKLWAVASKIGSYSAYLSFFPNGKHADEARQLLVGQQEEENMWQRACGIDTVDAYQEYINAYPNGIHVAEARRRINDLQIGEKDNIIRKLIEDRNAYPLKYLYNAGITSTDLMDKVRDSKGNIRNEVFFSWGKESKNLSMGTTPTSIPKGSTEVYFWGVPGSGKTCAMAAILSQARQMGCFAPRMGEGLGYMNELSMVFIPERNKPAVCLPARSDVETTQYLPLTLNETIEGKHGKQIIKQHDLSVIEISGEIFECFSCEVERKAFPSAEHKKTYEQLKQYLRSDDNPKYHFFILDSKPLRDADQMRYLQNAALYFSTMGIFNKTTQGISLIVTKSDELSPNRNEWAKHAEQTAKTYFSSLVTQLKAIVGDPKEGGLGLSDGRLQVIPLSIGEVFFRDLCLFDPAPATVLVNLLMEYSKVAESDDWKKKTKSIFKK